jgi:hypothetical protein
VSVESRTPRGRTAITSAATTPSPRQPNACIRGEQNEEKADQEHAELVLELAQVSIDGRTDVPDDDSGDRHGEDAAVRDEVIAALEQEEHARENHDVLVALGHDRANPQDPRDQDTRERPGSGAETHAEREPQAPTRERIGAGSQNQLEHEHCHDRSDRIDQNALGLEHRGDLGAQPQLRDQGSDDRRAGHHHEAPEQDGESPVPVEQGANRQRATEQRHERAECHQASDRSLGASQPRDLQVEAALEEDHGDREIHDGEHPVAEALGLDPAESIGTERRAGHEQQDDARHPDVPGERLREHAGRQCQRHGERGMGPLHGAGA